jgi:hypothetical protein
MPFFASKTKFSLQFQLSLPKQKRGRTLLGMVNFYRRFTPGIAALLELLTTVLKGGKKTLEWTGHPPCTFQCSKQVLTMAVPLAHPAPNPAIALATEASNTHIGIALHQQVQGSWQPLVLFSQATTCRIKILNV